MNFTLLIPSIFPHFLLPDLCFIHIYHDFLCHNSSLYTSAFAFLECSSSFSSSGFQPKSSDLHDAAHLTKYFFHFTTMWISTWKQIQLLLDCGSLVLCRKQLYVLYACWRTDIICFSICPLYESVNYFIFLIYSAKHIIGS